MSFRWTGAGLALLLVLPAVGSAQRSETPDSATARYRVRTPAAAFAFAFDDRPRLGLQLAGEAPDSVNRIGAQVIAVTEGSGAADAGIREGDIITRFDGKALDRSDPVNDLVKRAESLKKGQSVKLEYRRGSETRTATVEARELGGMAWSGELSRMEGMEGMGRMPMAGMMPMMTMMRRGGLGASFVEMNAGLGEYFGTSEGLLVTEVTGDSPLKAGDVVLTIDGREPQSVSHAMRILGSYESGEKVSIVVMRKRSRQTLEWTAPAASGTLRSAPSPARRAAPARLRQNRT